MNETSANFAAVLTPVGRGAVATVAVNGPDAVAVVDCSFLSAGKPLSQRPDEEIAYGRWSSPAGEEVVVIRKAADCIEVHCHGGQAAPMKILSDLVQAGCQQQAWRDWVDTKLADPIQIAASHALAQTPTLRTAGIVLDQRNGALAAEFGRIIAAMETGDLRYALESLQTLADRSLAGLHLTQPWRVVLAGRPNVGKSSLINAIVGFHRSIVFDLPGTTRDVVRVPTVIDGWPVELADTAGLRVGLDVLETEGVRRAEAELVRADLVLLVSDRSSRWTDADAEIFDRVPTAIVVHNKSDLTQDAGKRPPGLLTSTLDQTGLAELIVEISGRLVPTPPLPGDPVPFTQRLAEAVFRALAMLEQGQTVAAVNKLRLCLHPS